MSLRNQTLPRQALIWRCCSYCGNKILGRMWCAVPCYFFFVGFFFMDCVSAGKQCRQERSIHGMALQGFVFKKFSVTAPHECDISCERELTCQSYNYVIGAKSCELNNRTKEARPENFHSDPARFYMRLLTDRAPLGSIPELPAQSCQEIKASEGRDTMSNKYWLDPTGTGTAALVYCNMYLEDIDECITGSHDCNVNANCTNTVGSHNCSCKEGFDGDGRSCSDIDECSNGSHDCDVNANCTNTVGSHNCSCKEGFAGDGHSCSDLNECERNTHDCHKFATCINERGSYSCKCNHGYVGDGVKCYQVRNDSCSVIRKYVSSVSGNYVIDPDGTGGLAPFTVYCDMSDKNGVGVTVISHDSESRTFLDGYAAQGSYSRDIYYTGASLSQLASLTTVSSHCEQFIKYECRDSRMFRSGYAWWVSRDSTKMTYWGGASPGSGKCACGMTNSCADSSYGCNCDKNDLVWREDSGLLTDKTHLPVKQLRFGDTGYSSIDQGYHTLGKFKCYGTA